MSEEKISRGISAIRTIPPGEYRGKRAKLKLKTKAIQAAKEFRKHPEANFMVKLIKNYPTVTRQNLFRINALSKNPLNPQIIDAVIGINLSVRVRRPLREIIRETNMTPAKIRTIISMLNEKISPEFMRAIKRFKERNPGFFKPRPLLKKQLPKKQVARKHLARV